MKFNHIPVLLDETIESLKINKDKIYVDCTLGGGNHSLEIVKKLDKGKLICIDQDLDAIEAAKRKLKDYSDKIIFIKSNFKYFEEILNEVGFDKVDGVLMDIGVSSYQIDEVSRGFTYMENAPLDMRMDKQQNLTAEFIVNNYSEEDLKNIFYKYGEEKWSSRIAKFIVKSRKEEPIQTTFDLIKIIDFAVPAEVRNKTKGHYAKRIFQALRIEVNDELGVLEYVLPRIVKRLNKGGRLSVITFHSLEDRIVKNIFKDLNTDCICPPELPICVCNKKREVKLVNKKPIVPSNLEMEENSRSRSSKLRIVEKL